MDPQQREILRKWRVELVDALINIQDRLFTQLLSRNVLTSRTVNRIKKNKPPEEQVEEMLDELQKKDCFDTFCEALIADGQEHIVKFLTRAKRHVEVVDPVTPSATTSSTAASVQVKDTIVVIARSSKVRHTCNIRVHNKQRTSHNSSWSSSDSSCSSTDSSPVSPESLQLEHSPRQDVQQQHPQQDQLHHHSQQDQLQQQHHSQQNQLQQQHLEQPHLQQQHQLQSQQHHDIGSVYSEDLGGREPEKVLQTNSNLLSLQQRLHRDCLNLPGPSDHHNQAQGADEEEAEGYFHRISNRWGNEQGQHVGASQHYPQQHEYVHRQLLLHAPQQNADQPQFGSLQRLTSHAARKARGIGSMPSICPNAMNNRQKQLEALQRQEELLRSKSRALAAARVQKSNDNSDDGSPDQQVPDLISTRNKMDVHVLDIGRVLTDGVAEWKPLSELQPTGAPTETICCSILEGRGELMLFGGVVRNLGGPMMTRTAVNKLYILQPQL